VERSPPSAGGFGRPPTDVGACGYAEDLIKL